MTAGQTGYNTTNGLENLLFPLSSVYVTQGEGGDLSHLGTLVIDFIGWENNQRVLKCPYYAPCDVKLVARWGSTSPELVWESINQVNFVDGTVDYVCIGVAHDDDILNFQIGETRRQGELLGHTGTYGQVTGDHVHMEVAKGKYAGYSQNQYGNYSLNNAYHIYDAMGINGTDLVQDGGYVWRYFTNNEPLPPTPTPKKRANFPWVLYARKFR